MNENVQRQLLWILGSLNRRIMALEMDFEGRGSSDDSDEIADLKELLETAHVLFASGEASAGTV